MPRVSPEEFYEYDETGNLKTGQGGDTFAFDAENTLVQYQGGTTQMGGADYSYDGDGRRVKKARPSEITTFVYNISGQLVAEYTSSSPASNGTSYLTSDALGSPRVNLKSDGSVRARHDYLPFGGELFADTGNRMTSQGYYQSATPADKSRQKFTGKERDIETGLDYFLARYYSSAQGRFTSVDPEGVGADTSDPQSWNGYAYARNSPLVFSDPDGREFQICYQNGECHTHTDNEFYDIRDDATSLGAIFKNGKIFNDFNGRLVQTGTYTRTDTSGMWDDVAPALSRRLDPVKKIVEREAEIVLMFSLPGGGAGKLITLGLSAARGSAIRITTKGLAHVVARHSVGGARSVGKSTFSRG
jgi:RHS repeat-associated protein